MTRQNTGNGTAGHRCAHCRFYLRDRAGTELAIPGLAMLGSAFGASIGDSRLCRHHDRLVSPGDHCPAFIRQEPDVNQAC